MKKILIFGFPHCGTTILRCIISHIEEIHEIVEETCYIDDFYIDNKKFCLCKYPFTEDIFFTDYYKDYIKIFIIRNPLFVFSSLNKRFNYKLDNYHNISKYLYTINKFIEYQNNTIENLYLIKYENIFNNNFEELKNIFNKIGLTYTDNIFNNENYTNSVQCGQHLDINKITNKELITDKEHTVYRLLQINKPFVNNNDLSKICLSKEENCIIKNDLNIQKLYPENILFCNC